MSKTKYSTEDQSEDEGSVPPSPAQNDPPFPVPGINRTYNVPISSLPHLNLELLSTASAISTRHQRYPQHAKIPTKILQSRPESKVTRAYRAPQHKLDEWFEVGVAPITYRRQNMMPNEAQHEVTSTNARFLLHAAEGRRNEWPLKAGTQSIVGYAVQTKHPTQRYLESRDSLFGPLNKLIDLDEPDFIEPSIHGSDTSLPPPSVSSRNHSEDEMNLLSTSKAFRPGRLNDTLRRRHTPDASKKRTLDESIVISDEDAAYDEDELGLHASPSPRKRPRVVLSPTVSEAILERGGAAQEWDAWIISLQTLLKGKHTMSKQDLKDLAAALRYIWKVKATIPADTNNELQKTVFRISQMLIDEIPFKDEEGLRASARMLAKYWGLSE
ncbi:hypothetical protein BDQ12DRAFT_718296 [Crucibulum laeve]|uniref:Uncharacterized protein n=1 Tax=Crucibulum laeve TaxID=68775 RepID=A0A5C3MCA8_9AGAR|nr:hypothetical protein BDQ12DRAFT_718296 [Crucibulum laeve]